MIWFAIATTLLLALGYGWSRDHIRLATQRDAAIKSVAEWRESRDLWRTTAQTAQARADKGWATNDATTGLLLEARTKASRARQERDQLAHELRVVRAERDDHDRWHVCLPTLKGIREANPPMADWERQILAEVDAEMAAAGLAPVTPIKRGRA